MKKTGLPSITLHGLRHTHVTLGLKNGIDPKILPAQVGHSNIKFMYHT